VRPPFFAWTARDGSVTSERDTVPSSESFVRGSADALKVRLDAAFERRGTVRAYTEAYRWIDDAADGFPELAVDRYGDFAVLSVRSDDPGDTATTLAEAVLRCGVRGVYVKRRPRSDLRREKHGELAPQKPIGESSPPDLAVHEGPFSFGVALADGLSTGLFTDQRDNRALVHASSRGRSVLNLFSYTCTFTVAAALGGARETVSVDLSKRALARGRENLERNGASGPQHRLIGADAFDWLARAERRADRFDVVILDPPSFGTRDKGTFSVDRDYGRLAEHCFRLLAPAGRLLATTNHRKTNSDAFRKVLSAAARSTGRTIAELRLLPTPEDHAHRIDGEPATKSVLVTVV